MAPVWNLIVGENSWMAIERSMASVFDKLICKVHEYWVIFVLYLLANTCDRWFSDNFLAFAKLLVVNCRRTASHSKKGDRVKTSSDTRSDITQRCPYVFLKLLTENMAAIDWGHCGSIALKISLSRTTENIVYKKMLILLQWPHLKNEHKIDTKAEHRVCSSTKVQCDVNNFPNAHQDKCNQT